MDLSKETSPDLQKKIIPAKAEWWQSVETITAINDPLRKWPDLKRDDYLFQPKELLCGCIRISRSGHDLVRLQDDRTSSVMYLKDACEIMEAQNLKRQDAYYANLDLINKKHKEYEQQREFLKYAFTLDQYYNYDINYCANKVKTKFGQSLHPKVIEELKIEADKARIRKQKKQYDLDSQNPQIRTERLLEKQNELIKQQTKDIREKLDYQTRAIVRNRLDV